MPSSIRMRVIGSKELARGLKRANGRVTRAVAAGLYAEANNIMTDSKRLVPVDLGTLKNSGYAALPEARRGRVAVEIGYGGPAADYALAQHEHTEYRHPEGGEAKFLEKPVNERTSTFANNVAKHAKAAFERNVGVERAPGMPTDPWEGA